MRKVGSAMTIVGGAITGVMAGVVKSFAKAGDEVQKMALRTGFSTEALSEFRHAAELSGTDLKGLEVAVRRMQRFINDAGFGTKEYTDTLDQLGITYEQLKGLTPEKQFELLTIAVADIEDHTTKAALAQELFGRSGTALLPMLADGAAGLEKMRQEARDLGLVFSQEVANKAAQFNDALTTLKGSLQGVVIQIGPVIADLALEFIPKLVEAVKGVRDWILQNQELVKTIITVGAKVGPLLLVLGPLVRMLPGLAIAFKGVSTACLALAGMGGLGAVTAALTGPAGLILAVAATVTLVLSAIKAFMDWQKATDDLARRQEVNAQSTELQNTRIQEHIDRLRELGVAVDEQAMGEMTAGEKIKALRQMMRDHNFEMIEGVIQKSQESSRALIDMQQETATQVGDISEDIYMAHKHAWDLSLSRSPSILACAEQSFGALAELVWGVVRQVMDWLDGLRAAWDSVVGALPGFAGGGVIPGFQAGGVVQHRIVQVGERGPELVALPVGSRVMPHGEMRQAVQGGGGGVTLNFNGPLIGSATIREDADVNRIGRALAREVGHELRMSGAFT